MANVQMTFTVCAGSFSHVTRHCWWRWRGFTQSTGGKSIRHRTD